MRRFVPLLIAGAALIAAACSDSVAPSRSASLNPNVVPLSAYRGGQGTTAIRGNKKSEDNAKSFEFELRPQGGNIRLGGFLLDYPARAVCDPSQSSYGPSEWTNPCVTLRRPILVTVKMWMEDGRTHIDFSQDLRFDPSKNVTLRVKLAELKGLTPTADWDSEFGIWYSVRVGDLRYMINESEAYPELATEFETNRRGRATGWATRKIYHFSGYYVRSGRVCDDSSGDCGGDDASPALSY